MSDAIDFPEPYESLASAQYRASTAQMQDMYRYGTDRGKNQYGLKQRPGSGTYGTDRGKNQYVWAETTPGLGSGKLKTCLLVARVAARHTNTHMRTARDALSATRAKLHLASVRAGVPLPWSGMGSRPSSGLRTTPVLTCQELSV